MRILVDNGAAMNTGNKIYHLVTEYFPWGEGTEYKVVQLLTALDLDVDSKPSING